MVVGSGDGAFGLVGLTRVHVEVVSGPAGASRATRGTFFESSVEAAVAKSNPCCCITIVGKIKTTNV